MENEEKEKGFRTFVQSVLVYRANCFGRRVFHKADERREEKR